jgi:hypothetical protein
MLHVMVWSVQLLNKLNIGSASGQIEALFRENAVECQETKNSMVFCRPHLTSRVVWQFSFLANFDIRTFDTKQHNKQQQVCSRRVLSCLERYLFV